MPQDPSDGSDPRSVDELHRPGELLARRELPVQRSVGSDQTGHRPVHDAGLHDRHGGVDGTAFAAGSDDLLVHGQPITLSGELIPGPGDMDPSEVTPEDRQ